jgi:hypothetical protein
VGESVYFHENLELRRIELRSLETVGSYVYLHGNSRLAKARMDGLAEVAEYVSITENGPLCLPDLDWGSISDSVSVDAPVCAG